LANCLASVFQNTLKSLQWQPTDMAHLQKSSLFGAGVGYHLFKKALNNKRNTNARQRTLGPTQMQQNPKPEDKKENMPPAQHDVSTKKKPCWWGERRGQLFQFWKINFKPPTFIGLGGNVHWRKPSLCDGGGQNKIKILRKNMVGE